MSSVDIGLWVTGGLFVLVVLGMRVAFAAGMAGGGGLIEVGRRGALEAFSLVPFR